MDQVLAGRYRLGRPLGAGAMGRVVQATDLRLGRDVAIKLVDVAGADATTRERFVREARSAARLAHPNVVTVYDAGEEDGTLYLVMELVEGSSLAEVLKARGPLDPVEAQRITDQLLSALGAAHSLGVIHRDVKPSNVLLAGEVAKLADFGIATSLSDLESTLTSPGQVVGTVRYLAPERAMGQPATPASDVYAVGVVLYEMLAGAPPFVADSPVATMLAHQATPAPDLALHSPTIDAGLAAVVARALAKLPEDRYPSAEAMRDALRHSDASAVPTERQAALTATLPSSSPAASSIPPRRHRGFLIAGIGMAAIAALVVALALASSGDGNGTGNDPARTISPPRTTTPATTATTARTSTTATTATTSPAPASTSGTGSSTGSGRSQATTIPAFISLLTRQPGNAGEKLPDLLDKMEYVEEQSGAKRAEETDKLIEELTKWSREGELDPQVAAYAVRVLQANRSG